LLSSKIENINDLREKTKAGRASGDNKFYEQVEEISGRNLKPKKLDDIRINRYYLPGFLIIKYSLL